MNKTVVKGILFAITSAVLYGMCAVLTKIATKESLSVSTLIFGRGICGMVFLFLAGGVKRRLPKIRVRNLPKAALYGICGTAATQIFLNLAYFYLPVGTTTTIHFMYPAVVSILNALLFRQKVPRVTMLTLTVSTLSMFLFFESINASQSMGVLFAVLSVFSWTFQLVYMGHSGILEENRQSLTFYVCLAMAMTGLIYGLVTRSLQLDRVLPNLGIIALIAFLNNICATICLQNGVKYAGAGLSAVFSVFEPIASIVIGAIVLQERLSFRQILACALILGSICFMIVWNAKPKKRKA